MKNFDIITAIGHAYDQTWKERSYLLKLALVPFVVKAVFYFIALSYFGVSDLLRVALVMLPAYFVEGWMLSHWVRTLLTDHRWPFQPTGDDEKDFAEIKKRSRGIMAGTLGFVIINFLMAGFFTLAFSIVPPDLDPAQADPRFGFYGMLIIVAMLMLFRFAWSYIPLAVNIPLARYAKITSPFFMTFSLIGVWLVCFIPAATMMQVFGGVVTGMAGGAEELSAAGEIAVTFIRVFFDMLKNILVTAGMAFSIKQLLEKKA